MSSWRRHSPAPPGPSALLACLGVALAALAGCGSPDEPGAREIAVSQTAGPFHLDPAYAHPADGPEAVGMDEALSVVYTPLLSYRHASGPAGAELIPGLAQNLPEISADGRTYTLALREALEYPNGSRVRASDFEHTVKRVLRAGTPAVALLTGIEGVESYLEAGEPTAPIAGIDTDDASGAIVIRLAEPDASFAHTLAMPFAGLVPRNTRFLDRSDDPPPGVGPFEITDVVAGERFALVRSDTFAGLDIPDIPTGNVDRIAVELVESTDAQAQDVLDNRLDYMRDAPPAEVKSTLLSQAEERYREQPAPATHLFLLDSDSPPFDDPRVRAAANLALDKPALTRAFDGEVEPGCTLLPPDVPGYDEDLATVECPYGDPTDPPDEARARQLVEGAGATGAPVRVVGLAENGIETATAAYAEALTRAGLDARPRLLGREEYRRRAGRGAPLGEATFVSLALDFPHPLNAYAQLVAGAPGRAIGPARSALGDPEVTGEVARLTDEPEIDEVDEDWATLDRYVISPPQAYVAVFGHPRRTTFVSERLDVERIVFHPVFGNDYSTFALVRDEEP